MTKPFRPDIVPELVDDAERVNEETVTLLRDALARAEAGELEDVLLVGTLAGNMTMTTWTSTIDFQRRMGLIETLKLDWYRSLHEDDD